METLYSSVNGIHQANTILECSIWEEAALQNCLQEEYNEWNPQISPDGRWLAYVSDESNRNEVYVLPFPDINICEKQKVTTDGGSNPIWSPGSRELFYGSPDGGLMVVSVDTDPSLKLEKPQRLIDPRPYLAGDIDPENGKRFLVIKKVEETEEDSAQGRPRKIIVATNWFEELKKQVSAD